MKFVTNIKNVERHIPLVECQKSPNELNSYLCTMIGNDSGSGFV